MTQVLPSSDARFQVNLQGLIDLLSEHLYSGPEVFVRELLQNGIDALHMREEGDEPRPGIILAVEDDQVACFDSGCGLSADDVATFLATVGRSAKRDELGLARSDLIGQFGIGVLSCFLVSDDIDVLSRSHDGEIVQWLARGDGTYRTRSWSDLAQWAETGPGVEELAWLTDGPGTIVRLSARRDAEEWFDPARVLRLARAYAGHADADIRVRLPEQEVSIGRASWPWRMDARARSSWVEAEFGVRPLATFPVTVPEAGLKGLAVVSGASVSPGQNPRHRVYVKGMCVVDGTIQLLPPWGFFVHVVADSELLRPTASREQIRTDDLFDATQEALGKQVMAWLLRTSRGDEALFSRFLALHQVGLKALAIACDTDDFVTLAGALPFTSTLGELTLPDLVSEHEEVLVAESVDSFRQMAAVATAQRTPLVNAGYVYEGAVVTRFRQEAPGGHRLIPVEPDRFAATIDPLSPARRREVEEFESHAQHLLDEAGVRVEMRRFAPESIPALLLDSADDRHRRLSREAESTGELWAQLLQAVDDNADARPVLILNDANPMTRQLVPVSAPHVLRPAVRAVYARALLQGQHPVSPGDARMIEQAFGGLLDLALAHTEVL